MQQLHGIARKYKFENGLFIQNSGRYVGTAVEQNKIIAEIIGAGVDYEQVPDALNNLAVMCKPKPSKEDQAAVNAELVQEILNERDLISDFKAVTIQDDLFTYVFDGYRATLVQVGFPTTQRWVEILLQYKNKDIINLKNRLAPYINPKSPYRVTPEDTAMLVAAGLDFSLRSDLKCALPKDIKPITLSTNDEISRFKLEYTEIPDISFESLNPYMMEFLSRVSDHKHLCALLWVVVNGHKTPYMVYLHGLGGEGKSSFLNAISSHVRNVGSFTDFNQFSYYNMYGKAMLILSENTDCYLLQNRAIKSFTGNSRVPCEEKNKAVTFTANLSGTLFVDSNNMLKLKGHDFEHRRLRLFRVARPPKNTPQLDAEAYTDLLSEKFNEFINYCRVCFEEVGSKTGWLVPASARQEGDYAKLTDKQFIYSSELILHKLMKEADIEFGSKKDSIPSSLFWGVYYRLSESKDKYLADNIKDYLYLHRDVSEVDDVFIGFRKKDNSRPHFELSKP